MRWPSCLRLRSSLGDSSQTPGSTGSASSMASSFCSRAISRWRLARTEIALARADAQIDLAVIGLVQERPVEPREAVVVHLAAQFLLHLQLGLPPELAGDEIARPGPDAVGDVVAGDVEDLALIGDAADNDMGVRLPGVEVVDRHPIERGVEVLLHLSHEIAGEGLEVPELDAVLGGHDEPELVAVLQPAIDEGPGVGAIVLA